MKLPKSEDLSSTTIEVVREARALFLSFWLLVALAVGVFVLVCAGA